MDPSLSLSASSSFHSLDRQGVEHHNGGVSEDVKKSHAYAQLAQHHASSGVQSRARKNLGLEADFLRITILEALFRQRVAQCRENASDVSAPGYNFERTLEDIQAVANSSHRCSTACQLVKLPPGTAFRYASQHCIASGDVYVCSLTTKVHMCGSNNCMEQIRLPSGEGSVCPITSLQLCNEYSTANSRNDADHRFLLAKGEFNIARESTAVYRDAINVNTDTWFDCLVRHCDGNRIDAQRVCKLYGRDDIKTNSDQWRSLGEKAKQRAAWRSFAQRLYDVYTLSDEYIEELEKRSREAHRIFMHTTIPEYYQRCARQQTTPDLTTIVNIYRREVRPTLEGIFLDSDMVVQNNRSYKAHHIECILRLWESLQNLAEPGVTFEKCALGLLYSLANGFPLVVHTLLGAPKEDDPTRPRLYSQIPETAKQFARCHRIQIIPRQGTLTLATMDSLKTYVALRNNSVFGPPSRRHEAADAILQRKLVHRLSETQPNTRMLRSESSRSISGSSASIARSSMTSLSSSSSSSSSSSVTELQSAALKVRNTMLKKRTRSTGRYGTGCKPRRIAKLTTAVTSKNQPNLSKSLCALNQLYESAVTSSRTLEELMENYALTNIMNDRVY